MINKILKASTESKMELLTSENLLEGLDFADTNSRPFSVLIHPLNRKSNHKEGKKQLIKKEAAEAALKTLACKPFRASHYNNEYEGSFLGGDIVQYNGEDWVRGYGYLWSDEQGTSEFISKNKDDFGVSYEIATNDYEEDDETITPNKFHYKAITLTPKGESAFSDARILMADKNGGKENMSDMISIKEVDSMISDAVKKALDNYKKDVESGDLMEAKDSEIKSLSLKLEEMSQKAEALKKENEELKPLADKVSQIETEKNKLAEEIDNERKTRIKEGRVQKLASWLETISDKKKKEQVVEQIGGMTDENFNLFAENVKLPAKSDGQYNPNNEGTEKTEEGEVVTKDKITSIFARSKDKKGE